MRRTRVPIALATSFALVASMMSVNVAYADPSESPVDPATWGTSQAPSPVDPPSLEYPDVAVPEPVSPEIVSEGTISAGEESTIDSTVMSATFSGQGLVTDLTATVASYPPSYAAGSVGLAGWSPVGFVVEVVAVDSEGAEVTSFPSSPNLSGLSEEDKDRSPESVGTTRQRSRGFEPQPTDTAGRPVGAVPAADGANFDLDASENQPLVVDVVPGVRIEFPVDESSLAGMEPGTVRIATRESDEAWQVIPSYWDQARGVVVGELDHLSQFVVIGQQEESGRPRVVLDPDDDLAHTIGPGGAASELPFNVSLANSVATQLSNVCDANVVVTRTEASPRFLSVATRAGMAAAHSPVVTATLAFDAAMGFPWGGQSDGGSGVYSRGTSADNTLASSLQSTLPSYTGRRARLRSDVELPYVGFDGLPGAVVHVETLYLDHNYDRVVIDSGFSHIVDGVARSLGAYLEAQGFDCGNGVDTWPDPPTAEQLATWKHLGYQNYLIYGGDPVSFSTGNFVREEPLFAWTGAGEYLLDMTLMYNSQDGRLSRLGYGWSSDLLTSRVQRFTDGTVLVVAGDGVSTLFSPDGTGGFVAQDDMSLVDVGAGKLEWSRDDGSVWVFDASHASGAGDLVEVHDSFGAVTTLAYGEVPLSAYFRPLTGITLPDGQRITVVNDEKALVTSLTTPDGRTWSLARDSLRNLTTLSMPGKGSMTYDYDGSHRMTTVTDPNGVMFVSNTYDALGRVVSQTDGLGVTRTFSYESDRTVYTDGRGFEWVYGFDAQGQAISVTDPLGRISIIEYGGLNVPTALVDEAGGRVSYSLDSVGRPTSVTSPGGSQTTYTYDEAGRVISESLPFGEDGTAITVFARDVVGRVESVTDGLGGVEEYVRDGRGNVIRVVDARGNVWEYTYDERGNVTVAADPLGRVSTFSYDQGNRLSSQQTTSGATTTYAYDAAGRLATVTDPVGAVTTHAYGVSDELLTTTDPVGRVTSYAYDAALRVTAVTNPAGGVTAYVYDEEDNLLTITDPVGAVTSYEYDAAGHRAAMIDANGHRWEYEVDELGRVTTETNPTGGVTNSTYDADGHLASVADPDGVTTSYTYTALGLLASETTAAGTTTYTYDPLGRVVSVTRPDDTSVGTQWDESGNLVGEVDQAGRTTEYVYDEAGQCVAMTDRTGETWTLDYDVDGNFVSATSPLGVAARQAWDGAGHVTSMTDPAGGVTTYGYDSAGQVTSVTDPAGGVSRYSYDAHGWVATVTDPMGATTNYAYDATARLIITTDPLGVETSYAYDGLGNLAEVVEDTAGLAVTTSYEYTELGGLASVTDANQNTTTYEYSLAGRQAKEANPLGAEVAFTYDEAGRVDSHTDAAGQKTQYTYTLIGQVSSITYANGSEVAYSYDPVGNLISMTDPSGIVGWAYDEENRVVEQRSSLSGSVATTYNEDGQPITQTLPDGSRITWTYTESGRVESQASPVGTLSYAYDPIGRISEVERSGGVKSTSVYDAAGRVVSLTYENLPQVPMLDTSASTPGFPLASDYLSSRTLPEPQVPEVATLSVGYEYDARGSVSGRVTSHDETTVETLTASYDTLGRITGSMTESAMPMEQFGEPPVAESNTTEIAYEYDPVGNRTSLTSVISGVSLSTAARFDEANRLTRSVATDGETGSQTVTAFSYNSVGNRVSEQVWDAPQGSDPWIGYPSGDTQTTTYTYDADGYVAGIHKPDRDVTVDHDGMGRTVRQSVTTGLSSHTSVIAYDGLEPIWAGDNQFGATGYVRDITGAMAGQWSASGMEWTLTDGIGSVLAQIPTGAASSLAAGVVQVPEYLTYDPWGTRTLATDGWDSDHGYTGEITESAAGDVLFHARVYTPGTGTFTAQDVIRGLLSIPSTLNRYAYVSNDPLSATDMYGYWSWGEIGAAVVGFTAGFVCAGTLGVTTFGLAAAACIGLAGAVYGAMDYAQDTAGTGQATQTGLVKAMAKGAVTTVSVSSAGRALGKIAIKILNPKSPGGGPFTKGGSRSPGKPSTKDKNNTSGNRYPDFRRLPDRAPNELPTIDNSTGSWGNPNPDYWGYWDEYPKAIIGGREYAVIGGRYYTRHAVDYLQPSTLPGVSGVGRNISPNYVDDILSRISPTTDTNGRLIYSAGNVSVITEKYLGAEIIITVMRI